MERGFLLTLATGFYSIVGFLALLFDYRVCTVTFSPTSAGFILAMNRDEQITRSLAIPPQEQTLGTLKTLYPQEPSGGTWIGLSNRRVALALINWYSAPYPVGPQATSRGVIIPQLLAEENGQNLSESLRRLIRSPLNPFRLLAILEKDREIVEWSWDGRELQEESKGWELQHWISSGYQESVAQRIRGATAMAAREDSTVGSLPWVRCLHGSHAPEKGPFSICMHRSDARTVSYTEVLMEDEAATMRYCPGSPCSGSTWTRNDLKMC